jgi:hypothetical protein
VVRSASRTPIQAVIARGYRPAAEPKAEVRWVTGSTPEHNLNVDAAHSRVADNSVFVLCPTYLGKCTVSERWALGDRSTPRIPALIFPRPQPQRSLAF